MAGGSGNADGGVDFLPSTFSPWSTYQPLDSEHEYDPANMGATSDDIPLSPPRHVESKSNTGAPPTSTSMASTAHSDVSPMSPQPSSQPGSAARSEVVSPSSPLPSGQQSGSKTRQTRFVEMLRKSVTSPLERVTNNKPWGQQADVRAQPVNEEDEDDHELLTNKYTQPPTGCSARRDVYSGRWTWLFITILVLSFYSTIMSGIWLVTSIYQPRYGRGISSTQGEGVIVPSTASLLSTLFAKTIELSFVTVFVAFVGQVLTRRAFVRRSRGATLAEMTMRNWVIQPGSLLTYWEGIPYAAATFLGALTLTASLAALFYTTASDAMISPKLKFGEWFPREMQGMVQASYANPMFVEASCTTPIDASLDPIEGPASCLAVQYSGQSYHNLLGFMKEWRDIHVNGTSAKTKLKQRPNGKHSLYDNTTMVSSWIETEFGDPAASFKDHDRIINNATLAMPHANVFSASTDPVNGILQPQDLSGLGEYAVRASVVAPTVNVLCANVKKSELDPLVYLTWPNSRPVVNADLGGFVTAEEDWQNDVPVASEKEWLNKTAMDDVFRWGEKYSRRAPVFQLFPTDYNIITNTTVVGSDAIYLLVKANSTRTPDYTICEMRSWASAKCSTRFDISGTSGGQMQAHCEDPDDTDAYHRLFPDVVPEPSIDWKNLADAWRLSMNLDAGTQNANSSNARLLANMILTKPALEPLMPSMAEALAVYASSTLVASALSSTFRHYWDYAATELDPGVRETFSASLRTQEYTSSYEAKWQGVFYVVLVLVFVINLICLLYFLLRRGLVTDYTEPQNLFALSVNSPPSSSFHGSCGDGPNLNEMTVPFRVGYSQSTNHYYFEEAGASAAALKKGVNTGLQPIATSGSEMSLNGGGRFRSSYNKLSKSRGAWL